MLHNKPNQPTKFRRQNWVEINYGSHGVYNIGSQIKFKTSMIRSSLCDYSDAFILVYRTIIVPNIRVAAALNYRNKKIVFKNCPPLTDCTRETNNKEIDHAKDIFVVMPMYKLTLRARSSVWNLWKNAGNFTVLVCCAAANSYI